MYHYVFILLQNIPKEIFKVKNLKSHKRCKVSLGPFVLSFLSKLCSLAHRPGSFGRRRPLSVFDGSGVANIYLKLDN